MTATDPEFVRAHHVHYEVEPEEVVERDRREVTGFRVRLFATHGEERLPDPACPECLELRTELQAFARGLGPASGDDQLEIVSPATPRIYASWEAPGADEVHVTVRVLCSTPAHRGARSPEEGCLAPIAARLSRLGVPRR